MTFSGTDDNEKFKPSNGSGEEDIVASQVQAKNLAEYNAKKEAMGKKVTAKTVVTMDVKPWDNETDMGALEAGVRGIVKEGLVWGPSQLVAVGYGINMLQINLVVEDTISIEELRDEIADQVGEYAQSTDLVAMQKL